MLTFYLDIALLKNNARIATQLAKELCNDRTVSFRSAPKQQTSEERKPKILCVGGSIYDLEIVLPSDPKVGYLLAITIRIQKWLKHLGQKWLDMRDEYQVFMIWYPRLRVYR